MKHLALALSIVGFSSVSAAGNSAPSPQVAVKDVMKKSEAETEGKSKTREMVKNKKMTVEELKQKNERKARDRKKAANSRAKKAVKSL